MITSGSPFEGLPDISDVLHGWTLGIGFGAASQPQLALDFWQSVRNANPSSSMVLTGHSLGGGLAAFVGALTGENATIFNNIPFGSGVVAEVMSRNISAVLRGAFDELTGLPTTLSNIRQFVTLGEVATGFRLASPALSELVFTLQTGLPPLARAAANYGFFLEQTMPYQILSSDAGYLTSPGDLHSQSLMVLLTYADVNNSSDWRSIGASLKASYFNDTVASAIGFLGNGETGWYAASAKMLAAIAYSAVDTASPTEGKPFGDTGIRALFDDADELGKIVKDGLASQALQQALPGLTEAIVQFAGEMAFRKVILASHAASKPEEGIVFFTRDGARVETGDGAETLAIDLNRLLWNLSDDPSNAVDPDRKVKIEGITTMLDAFFGQRSGVGSPWAKSPSEMLAAMQRLYDPQADASTVNRVDFSLSASALDLKLAPRVDTASTQAYDPKTASLFVATDHNDRVIGTYENNIIIGGNGDDTLYGRYGKDILVGGRGNDTFVDTVSERIDALAGIPNINDDIYIGEQVLIGALAQHQNQQVGA